MKIKLPFLLLTVFLTFSSAISAYQFELTTKNMRNYPMQEVVVKCRDAVAQPIHILLPANDAQGKTIKFNSNGSLTCQLLINPNNERIGIAIKDDYVFMHDISLIVTNCANCKYPRHLGAAAEATVIIY